MIRCAAARQLAVLQIDQTELLPCLAFHQPVVHHHHHHHHLWTGTLNKIVLAYSTPHQPAILVGAKVVQTAINLILSYHHHHHHHHYHHHHHRHHQHLCL